MKQILNSKTFLDWPNLEIEYYKPVELFIDSFQGLDINKDSFKILYVKEAEAISHFREQVIKNHHLFDAVLTYDEKIMKNCKNAYFLLFGTSWIHNYKFVEKEFQVSHLTGNKIMTDGHVLRQKIHYKQDKIKIKKDFYISKHGGVENFLNNKILKDEKEPLFQSQFHICIENSKQNNYFTEKIMDCFVTKTVPIYWGCPNIADFFDLKGIFVVNNFEDVLNVCNSLNEQSYKNMIDNIEINFTKSQKFINIKKNLEELIKKIIKNNTNENL